MRDAVYRTAIFYINSFWGKPIEMVVGINALLVSWNTASNRFGLYDSNILLKCIQDNFTIIDEYKSRNIITLTDLDCDRVKELFNNFSVALAAKGKYNAPVAASKALHILAPNFVPPWDIAIQEEYECRCDSYTDPSKKYLLFCFKIKLIATSIKDNICSDKTLIKVIDEYNYSKYTKQWI